MTHPQRPKRIITVCGLLGIIGLIVSGIALATMGDGYIGIPNGVVVALPLVPVSLLLLAVAGITAVTRMAHSRLSRPGDSEPRYGRIIAMFIAAIFTCLVILYLASKM